MKEKKLAIHSENILPIIKKWLYSEKDIFLRELVSNACDAINKNLIINPQEKKYRIDINIDKKKKTISISDNGIGMTETEVEKYIAQIAFSGATDFMEKYKSSNEKDQIIGHFGLGFYSSYMVSEKVTIDTKSYEAKNEAVFWSCDGSSSYQIDIGSKKERGTTVNLHIDKENEEYLEEIRIKPILERFCKFLPFPIYLNDNHINNTDPLWVKAPNDLKDKDYLDFYKNLHPYDQDPMFWVHINVDYPFNLKGILYFPKIQKDFDIKKSSVKLFCNRVFVSDNCKDILPDYLMILKGAIDSPDIPLNVSRSYLQSDRTIKQLGSHISKKIADKLNKLYQTDREKFQIFWKDVEVVIKLGILQDDKFYDRVKNFLIFKDVTTDTWITIDEYLSIAKDKTQNKIFYTNLDSKNSHFINLYKEKQIPVLAINEYIDTAIINHIEGKLTDVKFQRTDGAIDDSILDVSKEKSILDADGKTASSKIADFFKKSLNIKDLEIEAKSLASDKIPAFIMVQEESRRMRDYMSMTQGDDFLNSIPEKKTLVLNTNSDLVMNAKKISIKDEALANDLARHVFDLAKLSQKELKADEIDDFVTRSNILLDKLAKSLA
jgi:molecular chaperone HtpG